MIDILKGEIAEFIQDVKDAFHAGEIKELYNSLESDNAHSLCTLLTAVLTDNEFLITEASEIFINHELEGSLTDELHTQRIALDKKIKAELIIKDIKYV